MRFGNIISALERRVETVAVPGMGDVSMLVMTVAERDAVHRAVLGDDLKTKAPPGMLNATVIATMLCDDKGKRATPAEQATLIEKFMEGSTAAFDALLDAANKVNGMSAKAVDDAEKN
jgi:hypothetical protein